MIRRFKRALLRMNPVNFSGLRPREPTRPLSRLIASKGFTFAQVSSRLGVPTSTLTQVYTREGVPPRFVEPLAEMLRVDPSEIPVKLPTRPVSDTPLGRKIREAGLKQEWLAEELDITAAYFSTCLRRGFPVRFIEPLAALVGVRPSEVPVKPSVLPGNTPVYPLSRMIVQSGKSFSSVADALDVPLDVLRSYAKNGVPPRLVRPMAVLLGVDAGDIPTMPAQLPPSPLAKLLDEAGVDRAQFERILGISSLTAKQFIKKGLPPTYARRLAEALGIDESRIPRA